MGARDVFVVQEEEVCPCTSMLRGDNLSLLKQSGFGENDFHGFLVNVVFVSRI